MAYRILITVQKGDESREMFLRSGDMGHLMIAKDMTLAMLRSVAHFPLKDHQFAFLHEDAPKSILGCSIELDTFNVAEEREEWISTYADRHYIFDLTTGEVASPDWSAQMDKNDSERNAA